MQRRRDDSIRDRIARARARVQARGAVPPVGPPTRKRRVPRREIQARRQRMIRWGVTIAGAAILLVIIAGVTYDRIIKPNQTLAVVGPETISRQEYWKSRANDLYEQAFQYQDFARFVGPDQQGQYLARAQQSLSQVPEVWGSTDVDPTSLERMIEDQIYLQGLDDLGLEMSPDEIRTFALNRFAPPGSPLLPPSPTPTLTAERAAMATSTTAALLATSIGTPIAGTPRAGTATAATPAATPVSSTPAATPVSDVTPAAPATPGPAEARATAEADFARYAEDLYPLAHLSQEDYEQLVAAPNLARQKVADALAATIGQSAPQVHAWHILVPTREDAEAARARIIAGEDFAAVAQELSTDDSTGANGGDLGWFTREEMVAPFAEAAFSLEPGELSEPVESEFGWHIIEVAESDADRPLTDTQIARLEQAAIDRWLAEQRSALTITSTLPPTPTPFPRDFQPPAGAPPPPPPTPLPLPASPGATPVAIPVVGTPVG
jgi:hypothetical protein